MRVLKVLLPMLMIAVSLFVAKIVIDNPPAAKARPASPDRPLPVDVIRLEPQSWTVAIDTYGTVEAGIETTLMPQVSGTVIQVSAEFENGGFIQQGDKILQIDPADYRIAVKTAEASLAQARAILSEQQSLSNQAIEDWKRLGRKGEPGDLVAQKPQLDAARAQVASARAQLEKARLDLARTEIKAPYNGRIKNKAVSIGQFVSPGTVLSEFFSTDLVRLRLPMAKSDLGWLELPELSGQKGSPVNFFTADEGPWRGYLSRSEGILDSKTRQLFVTATIEKPFEGPSPLVMGQFMNAKVLGREFENVFVLPSRLVRSDQTVLLAHEGEIAIRPVQIVWRDERNTIINEGLNSGALLISTPLGDEVEGLAVRVRSGAKKSANNSTGASQSRSTDRQQGDN